MWWHTGCICVEKALVKYNSRRSKTSLRGRFASRNGMSGCSTGYFKVLDEILDVRAAPAGLEPWTVGALYPARSTPFQMSSTRGSGPSPQPPPPSTSYESGDTWAADSHSSVTFPFGPVLCAGKDGSAWERRSSILWAETVTSFVAGDRCWKVVVGEAWFGTGVGAVSAGTGAGTGGCPLAALDSFSIDLPFVTAAVCFDRAIRPRFRLSRVNSQWISLRRQREQGKARSHRTRREWHESQAIRFLLHRRFSALDESSSVPAVFVLVGCASPGWAGSISDRH
jgi:hypothetical protein